MNDRDDFPNTRNSGFPYPGDDYLHRPLNIAERLVARPDDTFLALMHGTAMEQFRIFDGALLILETRPSYSLGQTVLAELPGKDYVLRKFGKQCGRPVLFGNKTVSVIAITAGVHLCGVLLWTANPHCEAKWDILAVR